MNRLGTLTVGYLSTYVPRKCGLATFTADLAAAVSRLESVGRPFVVAIAGTGERPADYRYPVELVISQRSYGDYLRAATFFNELPVDIVCLQHEFGIFGGNRGRYVLEFVDHLEKPVVVTLHTVLPCPHPAYRNIIRHVCEAASRVVVMNPLALDILREKYGVAAGKVRFIHHGVPRMPNVDSLWAKKSLGLEGKFVVSTFGLISRGKGLEYAILAVAKAAKSRPNLMYLILGRTHPNIVRAEGERYREELHHLVTELGVEKHVVFVDKYLDQRELLSYLSATDVYLTPYLNPDQVVSGTLAYAIGLGKPVVSTPYLYAKAMERKGAVMLVPFRDEAALAHALVRLAEDDHLRSEMSARALRIAQAMRWENVAELYVKTFLEVLSKGGDEVGKLIAS